MRLLVEDPRRAPGATTATPGTPSLALRTREVTWRFPGVHPIALSAAQGHGGGAHEEDPRRGRLRVLRPRRGRAAGHHQARDARAGGLVMASPLAGDGRAL